MCGFRYYFTPLTGVLFTIFARATGSLSVAEEYLALGGGPPGFKPGFTCPTLLGCPIKRADIFRLRGYHPLWRSFQRASARYGIGNFCWWPVHQAWVPRPPMHNATGLACMRFRLCPVRSPLLRTSMFLSLPGVTKMFQFAPLAPADYAFTGR